MSQSINNTFSKTGKLIFGILLVVLCFLGIIAFTSNSEESKGELNVKEMIFSHIGDAYNWHITTIGKQHISIPLPCIVIGQNGLDIFCSSKLGHEGHYTEYKGYTIAEEGSNAGKIVEVSTGERPIDISITKNVVSLLISCALLLIIFLSIAKKYKKNGFCKPTGLQAILEPLIVSLHDDIIKPSIGKNYKKFTWYLLTVFFFIFINNLLGIIPIFPGGANLTGNIAITFVLAALTFLLTNLFGTKGYWKEIFNPDVPIGLKCPLPIMQFIEFLGIFTKPIALCIRLFANMFAGHVMVLVLIGLIFVFSQLNVIAGLGFSFVSVLLVVFMSLLECLVCFIQAYVFMTLSALFIGMAQVEEEHE
ncbi:MAG: F0F1 ATP synthase subunit A [Paludibacteraceae bacterium]|nr:F0F1 ATP synthase subunit A [Paludibacteraceae bacterium]MBR2260874.1 F0F1 ATP synthase subunit A [Paludibacteraceae bacterium]MEE3483009.1 F0F1 ATP synthase subunit A [Bacteroidales bacterium]